MLRLARLAEDLLLLARLDEQAGQAGLRGGSPVDLAELGRSVVCRYADASVPVTVAEPEAAEPGDGGLVAGVRVTGVLVGGDRARLDRLIVNLVDNAVRYAKSSVVVSVRRVGPWAELAVTDDGPGIPGGRTGSGPLTGSPGSMTPAAGTRTRPGAPGSGSPSSGRPPRRTAAPPRWGRPRPRVTFLVPRRGCGRSSGCP